MPLTFGVPISDISNATIAGSIVQGSGNLASGEGSRVTDLPNSNLTDSSISLFELVDPRVCLPADQREDEDKGCAKGGN